MFRTFLDEADDSRRKEIHQRLDGEFGIFDRVMQYGGGEQFVAVKTAAGKDQNDAGRMLKVRQVGCLASLISMRVDRDSQRLFYER